MSDREDRIWIAQCLCPSRHCIMAIAFDPAELTAEAATERLRAIVADRVARGALDPWCGLCLSRDRHFEARRTRFRTMAEALPHLLREQARQLATRDWILATRRDEPS